MNDLDVKNEKRIVKKNGVTKDIVNAVVDCYNTHRNSVPESLLTSVASNDPYEVCYNIWVWVIDNIRYVKDPDGQQWIKTPARLIYDGCGDCKSMSILICSALSKMGIKNKFRFTSYDGSSNYTHVYPVAVIDGKELPVDAVAMIQRGTPFGEQVEYSKNKDYMNTTEISELSGLGISYWEGASVKLNDNISVAQNVAESFKLIGIVTDDHRLYDRFDILSKLIEKYETNEKLFRLACYAWLTKLHFSDSYEEISDGAIFQPRKKLYRETICYEGISDGARSAYVYECERYVRDFEKQEFKIEDKWLSNKFFQENWNLLETQIFPVLDRYKPDTDNTRVGADLFAMNIVGLYLFIPDTALSKTQRKKRAEQNNFVDLIIGSSVFTPLAALNYIYAGFVSKLHATPTTVYNEMFNKNLDIAYINDYIEGRAEPYENEVTGVRMCGDDSDDCYVVEYNPNTQTYGAVVQATEVKENQFTSDDLEGWINNGVKWFTQIWGSITGNKTNGNGIIPNVSDNSGSGSGWLIFAAIVGGGAFLLFRKNKKRRR